MLANFYRFLPVIVFTVVTTPGIACAWQMPREDVIDIPARSDGLCVSNLFQSNMVIQREKPINIWGWAAPKEQVEVEFADQQATVVAGEDGKWNATLPAIAASDEARTMTIKSGGGEIVLDNILVGDVWVLGGQSNMEFELAKVENGQLEIVSANFPSIRVLTVPYGEGPEMQQGFARLHEWSGWFSRHFRKGDWDECTPEIARELSAIGYVFARRVHMASNVPIGVIDASRGGTTVETWTPMEVLREMDSPTTQDKLQQFETAVAEWDAQADLEKRIADHHRWVERQTNEGKPIPENRQQPPADLRPGPIADHNHPGHCYAGMISPLAGLSIKGVIFHQGYNNAFNGSTGVEMYRDIFPVMIRSWREAFNDPELPFGIISLCTDGYPQTRDDYCEKMFNAGIEIRAAQYRTFLDLFEAGDGNVGFASTYDLRRRWYHPQVKLPAGERIARWALATQYGFERELQWKPPMITDMEVDEGTIVLQFDVDVGDPQDGAIEGFAIAAEDRRFHPADVQYAERGTDNRGRVQYDRKKLILSSPMVSQPLHFRFAWGRNPLANLQVSGNKDLPLATQRSDDWPMEAVPLGALGEDAPAEVSRGDRNKILNALREQDRQRRLVEAEAVLSPEGDQ
ncbi:MAG: hypothetical protein AAF456_08090 [Planctomycetota bacterium]